MSIFTEEVPQNFPPESIHGALKSLLRGTESNSTEYIEKYFENVGLTYIRITETNLEKAVPGYGNKLDYLLFDPQKTLFFMMDKKVWDGVQKIVEASIRDALNEDKQELNNRLKKIAGIGKDYDHLSNLFEKRMLFANIF
jgi:hypothetical protein